MGAVTLNAQARVIGHYDVIVAGGGPAGVPAAIASARSGARTLLVESMGALGGTSTNAGVTLFLGGMSRDKQRRWIVGGIYKELVENLIQEGSALEPGTDVGILGTFGEQVYFDIEAMKRHLDEMVNGAGVDLLFFTTALFPRMEGNRVAGLFLVNKNGLTYASGDMVIDCTGDADVVFRAGFETVKGRSDTGLMTAATLVSYYANMDLDDLEKHLAESKKSRIKAKRFITLVEKLKEKGIWKWPEDKIIMTPNMDKSVFYNNTSRQIDVDGTDACSVTRAMIYGRKYAHEFLEKVVRPYYPGGKNATLQQTFPALGVRETRKIVGYYILTEDDLMAGRTFDDTVALGAHGWDLPDPKRPSYQPYMSAFWGKDVKFGKPYCEIPYRCLIPKSSENLFAAGRCLSVKDLALGPVRTMPPCYAMGEAVGTAAAMCAKASCKSMDLPIDELREKLRAQGAILE